MRRFREILIQIRSEKKISQRELSYLSGVDHAKISILETKEDSNLNLTTLFQLAKGLGVHPKVLIDYEFDFLERRSGE